MGFETSARISITAAPEAVFDYVSRLDRVPEWQPFIKAMTPQSSQVSGEGARFAQTIVRGGKVHSYIVVVKESRRPSRVRFGTEGREPIEFETVLDIDPGDGETVISSVTTWRVRLAMKAFEPLLRSGVRSAAQMDLEQLKEILEASL